MSEQTTQLVTDLVAAWNAHDLDRIAAFYAPDYEGEDVAYSTPRRGPEDIRQTMSFYLQAFPDLHITMDSLIVQDNRAALAWIGQGTHQGRLLNIPPTGRVIKVRGTTFFTIQNCQIVHGLHIWDLAGALRAIGLLPEL
ncbi:MAG: ester cyclase [Anaerolineales bacterium]|nr:ester cyclase [Anaerolineales bacterium]